MTADDTRRAVNATFATLERIHRDLIKTIVVKNDEERPAIAAEIEALLRRLEPLGKRFHRAIVRGF